MHYLYIFATVLFALFAQLTLKWRVLKLGAVPNDANGILHYFVTAFLDPYIILSFAGFFIAALFWIIALSKFDLNYAYPIVLCVSILSVFFCSSLFFKEQITIYNLSGVACILVGLILISK